MQFTDRAEAGQRLANELTRYSGQAVVYALPRGGVTIGAEIARELGDSLSLIFVRKLGHPYDPEYAVGAVAEDAEPVLNDTEISDISEAWLARMIRKGWLENARRRREYFPTDYQEPSAKEKVAILVDDGMATGLTMRAAAKSVRQRQPKKIVVAVPVASLDAIEGLHEFANEVVLLDDPANFVGAVGMHYYYFPQLTDREVVEILAEEVTN